MFIILCDRLVKTLKNLQFWFIRQHDERSKTREWTRDQEPKKKCEIRNWKDFFLTIFRLFQRSGLVRKSNHLLGF